jgi:hypothetical protein
MDKARQERSAAADEKKKVKSGGKESLLDLINRGVTLCPPRCLAVECIFSRSPIFTNLRLVVEQSLFSWDLTNVNFCKD